MSTSVVTTVRHHTGSRRGYRRTPGGISRHDVRHLALVTPPRSFRLCAKRSDRFPEVVLDTRIQEMVAAATKVGDVIDIY